MMTSVRALTPTAAVHPDAVAHHPDPTEAAAGPLLRLGGHGVSITQWSGFRMQLLSLLVVRVSVLRCISHKDGVRCLALKAEALWS
ncbi:unnamed protein product [Arctogadus glacialis]